MNTLRFAISVALASTATLSYAANYSVDARGDAMGGVGVVSATYLTAPLYNPALTGIYRRNDDAGMILPGVGVMYSDQDQLVENVETLADLIDSGDTDAATLAEMDATLQAMQGDSASLELGAVAAFGIPNSFLSATVFGKAYSESFVAPDIYSTSTAPIGSELNNAELSGVNTVTVGILEAGVSFARYSTVFGQHMSFGFTPKIQRINTYVYSASMQNFDMKKLFDNSNSESTFNIDAGALWFYGPFRLGIAGTNLIGRDITTDTISTTLTSSVTGGTPSRTITAGYTYQMRPQFTVGAGFVADYFSLSADYDINEDEKYAEFEDNTQWARVGMEIDLLRQLQLRFGYRKNMAYKDSEGTFTGGVGISPLGLFELDVGVSYTNEDAKGGYLNFLATY